MLNRALAWGGDQFRYHCEADPRHAEVVLRDPGLEEAKPAATSGPKMPKGDTIDGMPLDQARDSMYRSAAAQHRPDIRYIVNKVCRAE